MSESEREGVSQKENEGDFGTKDGKPYHPGMRFDPDRCPECGEMPRGTLETLSGVAEFETQDGVRTDSKYHDDPQRDATGGFGYSGNTEIFWDSQMTDDVDGRPLLVCWNGHDWPAKRLDRGDEAAARCPYCGGEIVGGRGHDHVDDAPESIPYMDRPRADY
jgi:hypothetical protein